jgi:UDP-N-acetylmuramoyl-tripeptide--D-alanyl-D-alanine ligase
MNEVFYFTSLFMSVSELYQLFKKYPRVITDSRLVEKDSLFFALKGDNFNGNAFAASALEKGAAFSIIDDPKFKSNDRCILVKDVLAALQELSRYHRQQLGIPVLAITGTNGKTTTKELVSAVLSQKFNIAFTKGNLNNHIGVPLTLLSMDSSTELGIVEMGANHPGEIDALCRIALPDYGLITNVGRAHLEGFGSFEGIKKTKAELYRYLENRQGKIFINSSNPDLMEMAGKANKIYYKSQKDGEGLEGELLNSAPFMAFKARFPKGWLFFKTNLIGNYNVENALAALCIGDYFGIDPLKMQKAIEGYSPSNNRSQLITTSKNRILMDAYNANPTSMAAALNSFSNLNAPLKAVILGDMFELGESSGEEHQKIVDLIKPMNFSKVLLCGTQFSRCSFPDHFEVFQNSSLLREYLQNHSLDGYFIMVKGSRGMKMEALLETL